MRLTLRTVLAYMDDILEPADHQDISQKIEKSEFATKLLHRIRDVTRRMRMGAPKVSGRGMGLDPNTVAEYLDNVLSGERVPDFEKVCLESDVHLAEVAACHQILSLVLGEPADVEPALRRRMYDIVSRSQEAGLSDADETDGIAAPPRTDATRTESGAAESDAAESAMAGSGAAAAFDASHDQPSSRERPEVPEYLRSQRRSRFWPIAITALLAACLVVAVGMALWGWNRNNPMLSWLPWEKMEQNVAQSDSAKNGTPTNGNQANGGNNKNGETSPESTVPGATTKATGSNSTNPDSTGTGSNNPPPAPPPAVAIPSVPPADSGNAVKPAAASVPGANVPPLPPPLANTPVAGANGAVPPAPTPDSAQPPASPPPGPGPIIGPAPANAVVGTAQSGPPGPSPKGPPAPGNVPGVGASAPSNAPPTAAPTGPKTGTIPTGSEKLGRLISDQELLLRLPAGTGEWQRVSPGQTLGLKDRLLALPTFGPTITLSAGVTIHLFPETMLELLGNDPVGIPIVRVAYGRLVLMTAGKPDVRVKLVLGDTAGTLTFFDPEATAAVEVRPMLVPGTDPQTGPPKTVIALYSTVGQIDWTGAMGAAGKARAVAPADEPLSLPNGGKLSAPARMILAGSSADVSGGEHELPRWYPSEPVNPLDTRASQTLNQTLDGRTSVTVGLTELVAHRRAENRSLAARSLALIDEFDPFASLLNDPDQRAVWPVEIESLQAALARGPVVAGKIRAMFERERGKDGDDLYRLLWGYNKDQLQSGAAQVLVDDLDNESLDFRVLSFYNLQKIAGKTFDYRPEATTGNRIQPVRRWREQLKDGLIVPKGSAPSKAQATAAKVPELQPVTDAARGLEPPVGPKPKEGPAPEGPGNPAPPLGTSPKLPPPPLPEGG